MMTVNITFTTQAEKDAKIAEQNEKIAREQKFLTSITNATIA